MRMMKTLWLLGAAALALGLSGCGGGGSNTRPATPAASTTPPAVEMDEMPAPIQGDLGAGTVTAEISRAVGGNTAITFMKGEDAWTDAATPAPLTTLTGWDGAAVQDTASAPTERIVAYTNIEAAVATPFHDAKGAAPYTVMAGDTVAPTTTTNFPSEGSSFTFVDDPGTDDDERMFAGTLDGATGTFTCTVDPCTVNRLADDSSNNPTYGLVGGWSFTAADGQTLEVPDADYLAFGYWNMIDIESLAGVVPFYYGSMPYAGNVQALSGSATYNGNAAGGYEHKTYDAGTGAATSTFGHFTAAVRLNAFFGGEDGMSTIDGMVNAFAFLDSAGSDSGLSNVSDWQVMLNRTEVTGQNFMGSTNGGNWNGAFFGPSDEGQLPSGVAGGFNAAFENGAVKGAYGATR